MLKKFSILIVMSAYDNYYYTDRYSVNDFAEEMLGRYIWIQDRSKLIDKICRTKMHKEIRDAIEKQWPDVVNVPKLKGDKSLLALYPDGVQFDVKGI